MGLLAAVAGLTLIAPATVMVSRGEDGILIMGTTAERRVVVLVTSGTMLTVNGPRQGPAAALFARANSRVSAPAGGVGQTWVRPPAMRGDRVKALTAWVREELGVTEEAQEVNPAWLPENSFRPEAYLAPGDLVQAGNEATLRYDPEGGPLEAQARRQREVDEALKRRKDNSPLARLTNRDGERVFLLTFTDEASEDGRNFEVLLRTPALANLLAPRAEILSLRTGGHAASPGADAVLRAFAPRGATGLPAWAVIDAGGRVLATSVGYANGQPVRHGAPTTLPSAAYFVRQLGRTLPRMAAPQVAALDQTITAALPSGDGTG
ncbi:MAG: hypothetical protein ACO1SV_24475 [Fimbriimonas sp.]